MAPQTLSTQPQFPAADPYVVFMDAQRADERETFNARVNARHDLAHTPIATLVEFKPEQVSVHQIQPATVVERIAA